MAEDVKSMDRLAILDLIYVLGQSQGMYSRLYASLNDMAKNDPDKYDEIMSEWGKPSLQRPRGFHTTLGGINMPVTFFARIHAARKLLNTTEEKVVFYVTRAYDEYITEAAKMDDELNFIGNPARVKRDYLANAIEEGITSEKTF